MKSKIHLSALCLVISFTVFFFSISGRCHAQSDWQVLDSSVTPRIFLASSFINDSEGWMADNNLLLIHTSDGGVSWDTISFIGGCPHPPKSISFGEDTDR